MMAGREDLSTFVVRPFLPAKDFELSKSFYQALGFRLIFDEGDVCGFASDSAPFLLQNFYVKEWADNFMMQMVVHDLDAWWAHIQSLDLPGRFGVAGPRPPALQPWGLAVAYVTDPSGVLWHIAQKKA